ncbi:MAG: translational GTPase TypA [Patescibacteria group bacterium]|nr:translational GTPase TypA [Patescibacteria group bacterium]
MINVRNVAIIAHVDHGKTTMVDALLRQSKTYLNKEVVDNICIMDSNDLEKERGITIFSKNASVRWHPSTGSGQDTKINIIDTPGHADFGGEVERVLRMADGCLLLVDAKEGPMPQTRFVLKKALELKLKVIVVINKIDKPDARINEVLNKTFDLFIDLGADDETADFPVLYSSSKLGKAGLDPDLSKMTDISPLFDAIVKYIPAPTGDPQKPLQMLVTTISGDNYKGRIATGRVYNGVMRAGQTVAHINREGQRKNCPLTTVMTFEGLQRVETKEVVAGDIVAIAGIPEVTIGETIADFENPIALPLLSIEEPTVKMNFNVNTSPVAGKEGQFTTSRQVRERILKEPETDVALKVADNPSGGWDVSGRGELHLAILIERLRREGYELEVSRPQVITKIVDGKKLVPYEQVFIEVPEVSSGIIIQKLNSRYGELRRMDTIDGIVYLEYIVPTKGLFGFRSQFLTDTKGLGIINTSFYEFAPDRGNWTNREKGSLVAFETGTTMLYALLNLQDRGELFVPQSISVYQGQVVGQSSRPNDIHVNVCKAKIASNHERTKGHGVADHFDEPRIMGLEDALEYIADDELVEVTPKSIRIRKKILDEAEAKRKARGLI